MAILLRVGYLGTDFHGFQRQAGGLRTVQGELERALAEIYGLGVGERVEVRGASRTDAGVHARGQLVAFDPPGEGGPPPERIVLALRGRLPEDIEASAGWWAEDPPEGPLHPRLHNLGKHYRYRIRSSRCRDPLSTRCEWSIGRELDLPAMREAADAFAGEHDFSSFRAAGCQAQTTIRRLHEVRLSTVEEPAGVASDPGAEHRGSPAIVLVDVHGEAFLMHMVRIMVGSLAEVGQGRRSPDWIGELLRVCDRKAAGPTAPARGLCLEEVKWPREWPPASN